MTGEPREALLAKAILDECNVKPYQGFIFLCGGEADANSGHPASVRDALYRQLVKDRALEPRIRLAEHYKDWAHDSVYSDLLIFEQHLAELSSVIVLILESPGSLAELGLFVAVENFREKLLVVIADEHYKSDSFIRLGPVDYLEKTHNNPASCYSWHGSRGEFSAQLATSLQAELADEVRGRLHTPGGEKSFQKEEWLHKALLVAELVSIMSAITEGEIKSILNTFDLHMTSDEVRQILYILKNTGLIDLEARGKQRFYVCADDRSYLTLRANSMILDAARFRADALEFYRKFDKKRFLAITNALSRRRSR